MYVVVENINGFGVSLQMEILNHQGLFRQVQGNFEFRRYTDNNGLVNSSGKVFLIQRIDGSNFSNILNVSENLKILDGF